MHQFFDTKKNPRLAWVGIAIVALVLIALPFALAGIGTAWVRITNLAILFVFLALGLNIVVGFAGLLDLGYIAFYAVGAYVYALLASPHFNLHLPFWVILPIGAAVACLFGACSARRRSSCGVITWRSSRWASARSSASFSTTCHSRSTSPTARRASR
jgi:hypothetical protein